MYSIQPSIVKTLNLQEKYPVSGEVASPEIFSTLIMLKIQILFQVDKTLKIYISKSSRKLQCLTVLFVSLYWCQCVFSSGFYLCFKSESKLRSVYCSVNQLLLAKWCCSVLLFFLRKHFKAILLFSFQSSFHFDNNVNTIKH